MSTVAFPFAIVGFTFGMIAFTQVSAASARIKRLEQRLIQAGVLEELDDA